MKFKIFLNLALAFSILGACQAQSDNTSANVDVAKAQEMMANADVVVLDVRTDDEFNSGHIENAIQIDFLSGDFDQKIADLDKEKTYLVYCHSGNRSRKAQAKMKQMGFVEVINMDGGITAWTSQGKNVVK
jgi:rhodanese-related sulfurtransferase